MARENNNSSESTIGFDILSDAEWNKKFERIMDYEVVRPKNSLAMAPVLALVFSLISVFTVVGFISAVKFFAG